MCALTVPTQTTSSLVRIESSSAIAARLVGESFRHCAEATPLPSKSRINNYTLKEKDS